MPDAWTDMFDAFPEQKPLRARHDEKTHFLR